MQIFQYGGWAPIRYAAQELFLAWADEKDLMRIGLSDGSKPMSFHLKHIIGSP